MKKKAYYFSHDSNAHSDTKCIKLRSKYGLEGYGIYWYLIELLRDADFNKLETDYESLAFELRTECERIESVINDFDLFVVADGFFYSESLVNRMSMVNEKSQKASDSAKKRWAKYAENAKTDANALRTESEGNANKIKETKIKEIIYRKFDHLQITQKQVDDLKVKFNLTNEQIDSWIDKVENWGGNKKLKTIHLTISNWINKELKENPNSVGKPRATEKELASMLRCSQ